jgi:Thioredoxin
MTTATDITSNFFFSGLALPKYIEGMTKNRELFEQNYRDFRLNEEELTALRSVKGVLHILVLTEDWCGDAIRYLPALARMSEAAERWDIRIFYRDAHPELAGRWLKHGTQRSIPVLVFLDEEWNKYACFVEKPEPVYGEEAIARADFAANHIELPDASLPAGEMSHSTLEIFTPYMKGFRLANTDRWEHFFVQELTTRLRSAASSQTVGAGCW